MRLVSIFLKFTNLQQIVVLLKCQNQVLLYRRISIEHADEH